MTADGTPDTPAPGFRHLGKVPALDSLRAIAVLLVLGTHLWAVFPFGPFDDRWTRSGFLGVDLFFVLSGFLITCLLLQERNDTGQIRVRQFYARRALRLLPALAFFFAVYLLYSAANGWPPFGRRDFAFDSLEATALYYMNWRVLWNPLGAADLTAIWSLSIEEQFYLVWPVTLLGLIWWGRRRGPAGPTVAVALLAIAVTVWRAFAYRRWGWEAAYLRTDTRIDGLLWGSLAALLFTSGRLPKQLPRWTPLAVAAVWITLLVVVRADGGSAYYGGITLWVLTSAILIVHLANDPARFTHGRVADGSRRLGRVSYAAYLWQLPVLRAVERWGTDWLLSVRVIVALALLAACTLASWFLVERPFLRVKERLQARWSGRPAAKAAVAVSGDAGG